MTGAVLLAAGGTGGHVFPAEALAAELLARGYPVALVTDHRIAAPAGALGGVPVHRIAAGGIAGRGLGARARAVAELGIGYLQSRRLLHGLRPRAVIGFGSYASLPPMLAATGLGIPTALHEQNGVLGRANRMLAPRVTRIATSFAHVARLRPAFSGKVVRTGMPVRTGILARRDDPYQAPAEGGPIRILVLGGSQGARVLSEVVPAALAALPAGLRARLAVAEQCRSEDIDQVRAAYRDSGIATELATFFDDVPDRLSAAHLVISRAGASTTAELTAIGRPAILVPYLFAIDDHQTANARAVEEAGGAWVMPQPAFTAAALGDRLAGLLAMPEALARAAACARAAGVPDAAARLADLVAGLAGMPAREAA